MATKDVCQLMIAAGAVLVAWRSAMLALKTYKFNARTKSAEFLMALHKAFFVENDYKSVRDAIDKDPEDCVEEMRRYVEDEPSEFTDFLNFFELICLLRFEKTLKHRQVEALLGYYLDKLFKNDLLRDYVMNEKKGFEHLACFLRRRSVAERDGRHRNG